MLDNLGRTLLIEPTAEAVANATFRYSAIALSPLVDILPTSLGFTANRFGYEHFGIDMNTGELYNNDMVVRRGLDVCPDYPRRDTYFFVRECKSADTLVRRYNSFVAYHRGELQIADVRVTLSVNNSNFYTTEYKNVEYQNEAYLLTTINTLKMLCLRTYANYVDELKNTYDTANNLYKELYNAVLEQPVFVPAQ